MPISLNIKLQVARKLLYKNVARCSCGCSVCQSHCGESTLQPSLPLRVVAIAVLCTSCSDVVQSHLITQGSNPIGLVYSLPKGQVLVNASRTQISAADVVQAQAKLDQATAAVEKDKASVSAATGDATKLAAAQAALQTDQATLSAAVNVLTVAKNNVGKYQESASFTLLPIVPDPTAQYVVDLNHEPTRDDTVSLAVINGLLSSTSLTSVDQTPNIIVTLADTIITALQVAAGDPFVAASPGARPPKPSCNTYSIAEIFDPLSTSELKRVTDSLRTHSASITINNLSLTGVQPPIPIQQSEPSQDVSGIVYRVAVIKRIEGGDFNCKNITASLDSIQPDSNDMIFFYYAGHGFRLGGQASRFPRLYCGAASPKGTPLLEDVTMAFWTRPKAPKLVWSIADACNASQPPVAAFPSDITAAQKRKAALKRLFGGYTGTVLMAGADVEQYSWYNVDGSGSLFSLQLLQALQAEFSQGDAASWDRLLMSSIKAFQVPSGGQMYIQQPIYTSTLRVRL
jgi:Caspase domain